MIILKRRNTNTTIRPGLLVQDVYRHLHWEDAKSIRDIIEEFPSYHAGVNRVSVSHILKALEDVGMTVHIYFEDGVEGWLRGDEDSMNAAQRQLHNELMGRPDEDDEEPLAEGEEETDPTEALIAHLTRENAYLRANFEISERYMDHYRKVLKKIAAAIKELDTPPA